MKFLSTLVVTLGCLTLPAAAARQVFHWPWEVRTHHHRGNSHAAPTCAQINAVKKALPSDRYETAFYLATQSEQKIITDCGAHP